MEDLMMMHELMDLKVAMSQKPNKGK